MKYTQIAHGWIILPVYLLGGLVLGLADAPLGRCAEHLGTNPGLATAVSVNLLLPLLAIGLGAVCRRLPTVWFGAVCMTGAFVLGLAFVHAPAQRLDAAALLRAIPPVLVAACLGYAILGTLSALATRRLWK